MPSWTLSPETFAFEFSLTFQGQGLTGLSLVHEMCFISESWRFAPEKDLQVHEASPGFVRGENARPRSGVACPLFF